MFHYVEPTATAGNEFTDGDPVLGIPRTVLLAKWPNMVQRELLNVVTAGGVQPAEDEFNQVELAIKAMLKTQLMNIFPVGSLAIRPTNPGNSEADGGFGFGTWQKIAGRSPIGAGAWQDSRGEWKTFSAGDSEGTYKHKLTVQQMPEHTHGNFDEAGFDNEQTSSGYSKKLTYEDGRSFQDETRNFKTGGDQAHNNLHPTFAVPMWYRTA